MNRIVIDFQMSGRAEPAESCVTLPMEPQTAAELLRMQGQSRLLNPIGGILYELLYNFAALQGYPSARFLAAEKEDELLHAVLKEPIAGKSPERRDEYRGFVFLRCPKCGKERAFCAKEPLTRYVCRDCGASSELPPPTRAYIHCECGNTARYMTNITDWCFDIPCIRCGAPCAVEYHAGKRIYVPAGSLGVRRPPKRKKDAK